MLAQSGSPRQPHWGSRCGQPDERCSGGTLDCIQCCPVCVCVCERERVCVCVCVCVRERVCVCVCAHASLCVLLYKCIVCNCASVSVSV